MSHPSHRGERLAIRESVIARRMAMERELSWMHTNWTEQGGRYSKTHLFDCQCQLCRGPWRVHAAVLRQESARGSLE